jgi:hypothetical protein
METILIREEILAEALDSSAIDISCNHSYGFHTAPPLNCKLMSNLSGTPKLYRYDFLPFCKFLYHINAQWIMGQGNFGDNIH